MQGGQANVRVLQPERALLDFPLELMAQPHRAEVLRSERRSELLAAREAASEGLERTQWSRLLRSLNEAPLGLEISDVLRGLEDDIYLKGAVG